MTTITYPAGAAPLYHRYPRECHPQTAHLEISQSRAVLESNGVVGNAVPVEVWHERVLRVPVSCYLTAQQCAALAGDPAILVLVVRIQAGLGERWDGSNRVGTLTDDGEAAYDVLTAALEALEGAAQVWEASAWLDLTSTRSLGITAQTTDAELGEIARRLEGEAAEDGVVLEGAVYDVLRQRREQAELAEEGG